MNYFIFNKDLDYRRGVGRNVAKAQGVLKLADESSGLPGIFLSRILDSREKGMQWNRLAMDAEVGGNMAVYMRIYGTDTESMAQAAVRSATEIINDPSEKAPQDAVARRLEPWLLEERQNPQDMLLWEVRARYLWFVLILWGNKTAGPVVGRIQIYFPKQSWSEYLPELYRMQENSFLERFLAIFQTMYQRLESDVRRDAALLDICSSQDAALMWLARWLDMDHPELWPLDRLRRYLERGVRAYIWRGTRKGLTALAEAFTGETVYIQEDMTGDAPDCCRLLISERAVASPAAYQALLTVIREGKPADLAIRVTVLRPYIRLDRDTYLGINSRIGRYKPAALDGVSMLSMTVAAGGKT